jgi:hypothetical protein
MYQYRSKALKHMRYVRFPEYKPEKIYMQEFTKIQGLPKKYKHWQETVDQLLYPVPANGKVFLMVDCATVKQGEYHRRKGLHVDGIWNPDVPNKNKFKTWSYCPSWESAQPVSSSTGEVSSMFSLIEPPAKAPRSYKKQAIILASSCTMSKGYHGTFLTDTIIDDDGDCKHVKFHRDMQEMYFEEGNAYIGNANMLHETLPAKHTVDRQLIRLSVDGWEP